MASFWSGRNEPYPQYCFSAFSRSSKARIRIQKIIAAIGDGLRLYEFARPAPWLRKPP